MMKWIYILALFCTAVLSGCTQERTALPGNGEDKTEKKILIGVLPERNIFEQMDRYEKVAGYLSDRTDVRISLKLLTRYGNIIDNFNALELDGAFFGSFTYALAHVRLGVEPVARPENLDGTSTYHGLIFVRKDSGIRSVEDMKDKVLACVDEATTAGHLLPVAYFMKHNIRDYESYVKENYFAGTHDNAIYDVLNGRADIGAAKNTVFEHLSRTDERIKKQLLILERSPKVPQNTLAVRSGLDTSIKKSLKEALLNMHKDPEGSRILEEFGAKRFIETTNEDYAVVFRYARTVGLDLATYDYTNN